MTSFYTSGIELQFFLSPSFKLRKWISRSVFFNSLRSVNPLRYFERIRAVEIKPMMLRL